MLENPRIPRYCPKEMSYPIVTMRLWAVTMRRVRTISRKGLQAVPGSSRYLRISVITWLDLQTVRKLQRLLPAKERPPNALENHDDFQCDPKKH